MTRYTRHPQLVSADMDGDLVMMSVEDGHYYGLGGIGPRIWALLETPITAPEIADAITSEYDVVRDECERDVDRFLESLLGDGLIVEA